MRSAGRRALTRLKDYERQIDELRQNGHGESFTALFPEYADADHDEEDDYQPDQTADDRESNGNPADLFAPGEMPPAASGRKTDPAEPITDEDYVELQRQNEELRANLALREKKSTRSATNSKIWKRISASCRAPSA